MDLRELNLCNSFRNSIVCHLGLQCPSVVIGPGPQFRALFLDSGFYLRGVISSRPNSPVPLHGGNSINSVEIRSSNLRGRNIHHFLPKRGCNFVNLVGIASFIYRGLGGGWAYNIGKA